MYLVEYELASGDLSLQKSQCKSPKKGFERNLGQDLLSTWPVQSDVLLLEKTILGQRDFVKKIFINLNFVELKCKLLFSLHVIALSISFCKIGWWVSEPTIFVSSAYGAYGAASVI